MRICTFNLENFDEVADPGANNPSLAQRIAIMRPQLVRTAADIICLQEVHSQTDQNGQRNLGALNELRARTNYANYHVAHTLTAGDPPVLYDERNLVVLSRYQVIRTEHIRAADGPRPSYQMATANPPDNAANPVSWERPILYLQLDLGGLTLHVMNLHLKSKMATSIPGGKNGYQWTTVSGLGA